MNDLVSIILFVFGILQIILFFKIWGMTNDVKELKNYIIYNNKSSEQPNHSMPSRKEIITDEARDNNIDVKEGSVVYGKKDNKKYTVVKVLSNRMLRLDDGSNKPQYDELSIEDVSIQN